ncbi:ANL_HP_G0187170.mRNA.1.CDS.1 [Saccharomyces cerevisiae]|nr:ANL_HP_G0187170.mRNA.1.CDS.1 [Saccharomyces cerevisiae]CAI6392635.1 ANL_HP_G0187170.mRNA.1.CDS.1 [Saccharomyces cerevisiae]
MITALISSNCMEMSRGKNTKSSSVCQLLKDSYFQKTATYYSVQLHRNLIQAGGTGELLDWNSISDWVGRQESPESLHFMLAGGLTPENVGDALRLNGVIGVDVSGGVETNGVKDFNKIANFVKNAKK